MVTTAWVCGVLGLCCCFLIPIYGMIQANKAKEMGHPNAQGAFIFNIVALVLNIGSGIVSALTNPLFRGGLGG
jgi:hypothetical protein